jgi:hypothetical protein
MPPNNKCPRVNEDTFRVHRQLDFPVIFTGPTSETSQSAGYSNAWQKTICMLDSSEIYPRYSLQINRALSIVSVHYHTLLSISYEM